MALNGTFRVTTSLTNSKDNVDLTTPSESLGTSIGKTIATGKLYHDTLSLSASQITSLDVGNASLSDVYGQTVSLSGVTGLYVKAGTTNGGDFTVSGGANSFLNTMPALGAGEGFSFLTDIDVTTNSKIYFVNGATSGSVDFIVTGNE